MKWFRNLFRKKGAPKNENPPPYLTEAGQRIPVGGGVVIYINGKPIAIPSPYPYPVEVQKGTISSNEVKLTFTGLYEQDNEFWKMALEQAIESENYEEAARIRDIIAKK